MRKVIWTKKAEETLRRIPRNVSKKIVQKVMYFAENPLDTTNVKKLKGSPHYRLRVGDWRVLFSDDGLIVEIFKVVSRGSAYKK